jgi:hypothetical protein
MGFNFTTKHHAGVYNTTRLGDGWGNWVGTLRKQPSLAMYDLMDSAFQNQTNSGSRGGKTKREAYLSVLKLSRYFTFAFILGRALRSLAGLAFAFDQNQCYFICVLATDCL